MDQRLNRGVSSASQIVYNMEVGASSAWKGIKSIGPAAYGLLQMVDATAMATGVVSIQAIGHLPAGPILSVAGTVAALKRDYNYQDAIADVNRIAQNPTAARIIGYGILATGGAILWNLP